MLTSHPLSLYLHIPFCDHRCAYCDFNAYAGLDALMPAYTDALVAEIAAWSAAVGRREAPTVFFGGGTPSLLPLPLMSRVIEALRTCFAIDPDAEWSLEANPGTVDAAYFRGLRTLGVNRVSIGVQSFDDTELRRLDRIHDGATAEAAYHAARSAGFDDISLDLIYGLEGQTAAGWERNILRALTLAPEHLSLYALTIEEGTPLAHRVARGAAPEPDGDAQADMYERAQELLGDAGYVQYEISNWSKPGRACRHNLVYWRDGEWLGLGAGAHSHLRGGPGGSAAGSHDLRFAVMNSPAGYTRRVREAALPARFTPAAGTLATHMPWISFVEESDPAMAMSDAAIMALRLSEGLSLLAFERRFGVPFDAVYGDALRDLDGLGLVERDGDRLRITARGRLLSNEVFARLMPARASTARSGG